MGNKGQKDTGCKNQHGGIKTGTMDWTTERVQRTEDGGWMTSTFLTPHYK